jgi:hypothetical protein
MMDPEREFDQERAVFRRVGQNEEGPLRVAFGYCMATAAIE